MDKNNKSSLLETATIGMFSGALIYAIFPSYWNWGFLIFSISLGSLLNDVWKRSEFDRVFKALNLGIGDCYPTKKSKKVLEDGTIEYEFTLPDGLCQSDFEKHKEAISQAIGKCVNFKYGYKNLYIEVFDKMKEFFEFAPQHIKGDVGIMIGYNRRGELITIDLSEGEPHMLIAGETGSGKSVELKTIITNAILTSNFELYLGDLKMGAEFNVFQRSSRVKVFARTKPEIEQMIGELEKETDRRYNLFYDTDCISVKDYNSKFPKTKLPYKLVVIDEFADLMNEGKTISSLETLAAKSRAAGIHLIISTQRPDCNIINGRIRANVTTILGLKALNDNNSKIIIDHTGLENLRGKGHAILRRGDEIEIQCPYLDIARCQELIKHTYVDKKKAKDEDKKVGEVKELNFFDYLEK